MVMSRELLQTMAVGMKPLLQSAESLVVGQRLHSALHGGKDGTVVQIHGVQQPASVSSMGGVGVYGGAATFDVIWDDGSTNHQLPEALVRASVQWRVYAEVHDRERIREAHQRAAQRREQDEQAARRAAQADQAAKEAVARENPHLQKVQPGEPANAKLAAKNLRADLKRNFPGVKFSVRSDHNSLTASWDDGPTSRQVDAITSKYENSTFDGMQDMSIATPTAFTDMFGGARWVSTQRNVSDQLHQLAIDALFARLPVNLQGVPKPLATDLYQRYDRIPHLNMEVREAANFLVHAWDARASRFDDRYRSESDSWLIWDEGNVVCPALTLTTAGPGQEEAEPDDDAEGALQRMRG